MAASDYSIKIGRPNSFNIRRSLDFIDKAYKKSLFKDILSPHIKDYLESNKVSYFNHHYGFTLANFRKNQKLQRDFDVVATYDRHGDKFVAIVQHKKYPIIGTQFHPEFQSSLLKPHPLFVAFVKAAKRKKK